MQHTQMEAGTGTDASAPPHQPTYLTNPGAIREAARAVYAAKAEFIYADDEARGDKSYDSNVLDLHAPDRDNCYGLPVFLRVHRNGGGSGGIQTQACSPQDPYVFEYIAFPCGQVALLTPEQATKITRDLCSPMHRWAYYQGLLPFSWAGFFSANMCSFCSCGGLGFDMVLCKVCHKLACALCATEMRTGVATEGSTHFEYRRQALVACAAHGDDTVHIAKRTLPLIAPCIHCDVCMEPVQWGMQWWRTSLPATDSADSVDVCIPCAETPRGQELLEANPSMVLDSVTAPMGINEFAGLGVLADWVVVASYTPGGNSDDDSGENGGDSDDDDTDYFNELLVFVRDDGDQEGGSSSPPYPPCSYPPDPALRTMVLISDDNARVGIMGLPLDLQELLDVIAAGRLTKVLKSHGFVTFFE